MKNVAMLVLTSLPQNIEEIKKQTDLFWLGFQGTENSVAYDYGKADQMVIG